MLIAINDTMLGYVNAPESMLTQWDDTPTMVPMRTTYKMVRTHNTTTTKGRK